MIKYALICGPDKGCGQEFEAWFSNSTDYEMQAQERLVPCPICGGTQIDKAIMAPAVQSPKKSKAAMQARANSLATVAAALREGISQNCDDVGDKFADEARAIHYGEKPERGIYGQAKPAEAKALLEEGIKISALPDAIVPKPKKMLN